MSKPAVKTLGVSREGGFTLIELSIVIIILGILMVSLIPLYENYYRAEQVKELKGNVNEVRAALGEFRRARIDANGDGALQVTETDLNERLPCPAPRNARIGAANYGVEQCPAAGVIPPLGCNAATGVCVVNGTAGIRVMIGAVPTRTLQVPGELAYDPYGNRLTYAVSFNLTGQGSMTTDATDGGAITIVDETLNPANPAGPLQVATSTNKAFALVSHGQDGAGSFTADGVQNPRACRSTNVQNGNTTDGDAENCDGDATFRVVARDTASNTNTQYYDDTAAFTFTEAGAGGLGGDQWWEETAPGSNIIRNKNTLSVMVQNALTVGTTATVAGDIESTNGTITAKNGAIVAKSNITSQSGNIVATAGEVTAAKNITSSAEVRAKNNVVAEKNVVSLGGDVTAKNNITAQTGKITAKTDVIAGGKVSAIGDVETNGSVTAAKDVDADNNVLAKAFFYKGGATVIGPGTPTTVPSTTVNYICPKGYVLQSVKNSTAQCIEQGGGDGGGIADMVCPDGKFVKKFVDGKPVCDGYKDGNNPVVVVETPYWVGASQMNAALERSAQDCIKSLGESSRAYCEKVRDDCRIETGGSDGSNPGPYPADPAVRASYNGRVLDTFCQKQFCGGSFTGASVMLTEVTGVCPPTGILTEADRKRDYPFCPSDGKPTLKYACFYGGPVEKR